MKKFLMGLLVVVMVLGLTACSPEVSSKLGDAMGKMSTNIYGIKANMVQVEKATESVDNSVSKDNNGNVQEVNLSKAAEVMDQISNIKGSDQKRVELKASLSATVSGSDDATAALAAKTAIQTSASSKKVELEAASTPTVTPQLKTALVNALAAVENSLTDNPTKAELATVAVISEMADVVMAENVDEEVLREKGQAALDTLKVITDFGGIDLLADADIAGLLSAIPGDRSVSRDDEAEAEAVYAKLYSTTLKKVIEMISDNSQFVLAKYNSFILQAKAMKTAYDMISTGYIGTADSIEAYDALLTAEIDHGLTLEDMVKYLVSWLVVELDTIDNAIGGGYIASVLGPIVNNNYALLVDMEHPEAHASFSTEGITDELLGNIMNEASIYLAGDNTNTDGDIGKLLNDFMDSISATGKTLYEDFFRFLGTSVVILIDAEWHEGLFSFVKDENGHSVQNISQFVAGLQNMLAGLIAEMGE